MENWIESQFGTFGGFMGLSELNFNERSFQREENRDTNERIWGNCMKIPYPHFTIM